MKMDATDHIERSLGNPCPAGKRNKQQRAVPVRCAPKMRGRPNHGSTGPLTNAAPRPYSFIDAPMYMKRPMLS
jgi:hypothetical protein